MGADDADAAKPSEALSEVSSAGDVPMSAADAAAESDSQDAEALAAHQAEVLRIKDQLRELGAESVSDPESGEDMGSDESSPEHITDYERASSGDGVKRVASSTTEDGSGPHVSLSASSYMENISDDENIGDDDDDDSTASLGNKQQVQTHFNEEQVELDYEDVDGEGDDGVVKDDDDDEREDDDCEEGEIKEPGNKKPSQKSLLIFHPRQKSHPRSLLGSEQMKKASQRKEQESNFEEKRLNLSVDEEREMNKENERRMVVPPKDPYYDQQAFEEDEYYKPPGGINPWQSGRYENFEVRYNRERSYSPYRFTFSVQIVLLQK
nr:hypothetical protein BaRGS_014529 [Batillaria attramentaria]